MKRYIIREALPIALPSVIIFALPIFSVALLLRNLGVIIAKFIPSDENAKFDFALIFEQLRDARLSLHWALPLVLAVLLGVLLFFAIKNIKSKLAFGVIAFFVFIILLLLSFVSSLMLTSVNGIRFCDLLSKLIVLIDKL
jgi:Cu/Ag efflux pump CusA